MNDGIDPGQDVVLKVSTSGAQFIMKFGEALEIAMKLNSCNRVQGRWREGKDRGYISEPTDAAQIIPITTLMRMEWEATRKEMEEKK